MVVSIEAGDLSGLEARVDVLARWLVFWTGIVVLGLALEYLASFGRWARGRFVRVPPYAFWWVPAWALLGGAMVVGGVSGELYVGFHASKAEADLRTAIDTSNAGLKKLAGEANERASKNEKEAARLRKLAEDERLKRVEIERELVLMGSRENLLQGQNAVRLAGELHPFAGQRVEIRTCRTSFNQYFVDREAMSSAELLRRILQRSGWRINPPAQENCGGMGVVVEINSKSSDSTRRAADALVSALRSLPIVVGGDKVFVNDLPRPPQEPLFEDGKRVEFPALGADTIVIMVLTHP